MNKRIIIIIIIIITIIITIMSLHWSLSFQTTWKTLIAAPKPNVLCVYLMLPCLASLWEISKTSTRVQYSVIALCIAGKCVIFVEAKSFFAYIDARILTNLGTPWEVSALCINFHKVNNRRSWVSWLPLSVFVSFAVPNCFGLTLGSTEWIQELILENEKIDVCFFQYWL